MKRLLLAACAVALVAVGSADAGPVRRAVQAVRQHVAERRAERSAGGCQPAPAGPVRSAAGAAFQCVGSIAVDAGNRIHTTSYVRDWNQSCPGGTCPTIPSPGLPVR